MTGLFVSNVHWVSFVQVIGHNYKTILARIGRVIELWICFEAASEDRFVGPITSASPQGFRNDLDTTVAFEDGIDLSKIVKLSVRDTKRLFTELSATPGRWFVGEDNGCYEVCLSALSKDTRFNPIYRFYLC
jgi:hypothetical protein